MNKILIRCDGKDIILRTNRSAKDIYNVLNWNERNMLFSIDSVTLADEEFKDEIIVKPTKITLIKDVTEDEYIIPLENSVGIDKLADKIIKEINKQTRTTIKLDGVNINRFKER